MDQDSETSAAVEVDLTNVEVEGELEEPVVEVPPPPAPIPAKQPQPQTKDSRIVAAEKKVQENRAARNKIFRVTTSALRTYFLWHDNEDLPPESIAKLLRTPPLQTNTVVSYIMDAIVVDHMPFSKSRLRSEVLVLLAPDAMRRRPKYQALIDKTREET